jgi:methionyl-tRNA formyltransferase
LHDKLLDAALALLPQTLRLIEQGEATERPQSLEGACYARKIETEEARIDWRRPAIELDRTIRGLSPLPGAWFELPTAKGRVRVKALASRLGLGRGEPGEALDDGLLIACGEGAVRLLRVQREGRTPQSGDEFLRGLPDPEALQLL